MTYGICGSRRRTDSDTVARFIASLPPDSRIVSGGCAGPDSWAEAAARSHGLPCLVIRPDRSAITNRITAVREYHARNRRIAEACDTLVALPAPDRKGGTEVTIAAAEALGKPVILL